MNKFSGFPVPPRLNRQSTPQPDPEPAPVTLGPLPTPPMGNEQGKLNEDETQYILRTTLLAEHREDPNVLRFIAAYMRCRDAGQAAREAGLTTQSGRNLRSRPDIHLAIERLTQKSVMKYGYDASEVIEKVKEAVTFDPIELENPDGSYKKHLKDIAPEARRNLKKLRVKNLYETDPNGMKVLVGEIIEYEFYDKLKAAELLGREKDIFKETKKVEHDVTANMASVLLESATRGAERAQAIDVTAQQAQLPAPRADNVIEVEEEENTANLLELAKDDE